MRDQKAINKKISESLKGRGHGDVEIICEECKNTFSVPWNRRHRRFCSISCATKNRQSNPEFAKKFSKRMKEACSSIEAKKRLRNIGRKGGFGTKGITRGGTRFESLFEKEVFEFLENEGIVFEAHKPIPGTSKVSDIYLPDKDLWIELDGIDREAKKEWLEKDYEYWIEKLKLYKKLNLNHCIITKRDCFKHLAS